MAATVNILQYTGAGPSSTAITNLRFNTDDTANPGTTNPLVKPAAGTNRSYWKTVKLNCTVQPDNGINNVKFYSDGDLSGWTGCTVYVGTSGAYTQATGTPGTSGDDSAVATALLSGFTSGSPKSVTGSIGAATGPISDYVVLQVDLSTSAVAGTLAAETVTFQYDET